jgi:hypothetical protein
MRDACRLDMSMKPESTQTQVLYYFDLPQRVTVGHRSLFSLRRAAIYQPADTKGQQYAPELPPVMLKSERSKRARNMISGEVFLTKCTSGQNYP